MKFEGVLPALREGKKIRRKSWAAGRYLRIVKDDLEYGTYLTDERELADTFSIGLDLIGHDDWEIVPEPRKIVRWLNLYPRGFASWDSKEDAEAAATPDRIECRKIEWEVPG